MYDEGLGELMARAAGRIVEDMTAVAPAMAEIVGRWIRDLSPGGAPEDYFKYPVAYPIFLLPWWIEKSIAPERDEAFMADVVYSTMCGYYYIRLLDNLIDAHATSELDILPAAAFFHTRFQSAYLPHFPAGHPFWAVFEREWFRCAEAVILDHRLDTVDRLQFRSISARKLRAALIPIAAVSFRHDRQELIERWTPYCDLLACCVQMTDDVFDWQMDLGRVGAATYFLSEGGRRKRPDESVSAWVMREGFAWGTASVRESLRELRDCADSLECPEASAYVDWRLRELHEREETLAAAHAGLARIAVALE